MEDLLELKAQTSSVISDTKSLEQLELIRLKYLGKKGKIQALMRNIGQMDAELRKTYGADLNKLKTNLSSQIELKKQELETEELNKRIATERIDVTLPIRQQEIGSQHPITKVIEEISDIFAKMGFVTAEGPEIEDDFHNFTALNIPENHPARQMHDTFYFPEDESGKQNLLRTHTSSVQIRYMQNNKPPYRVLSPGRVYRCDSDLTHSPMFHQMEGLYIDKNINMGHLKYCLKQFLQEFFQVDEIPTRFRPSFFPFTEPSAEMDIGCTWKNGEFSIGSSDKWMEILGCGMVHPNVLTNVNIDPNEYQGFAFGVGIERLAMLKYGITDMREMFNSDMRWLQHYGF